MAVAYNSSKIVTNGLILCLDAANRQSYPGSGTTWADLSGNGNNGTLTNGPTYTTNKAGAIVFDGVNDFVINSSTNNMPLGASSRTVQVWFYPTTSTNNLIQIGGSPGQVYLVQFYTTGGPYYLFTDGVNVSNNLSLYVEETPILNAWNNLVFGNNGQNWFYYLNNKLIRNGTFPTTLNTVNQRYLIANRDDAGGGGGLTAPIKGNVAQVLLYNRALSAAEIAQNYNASKSRFTMPTIVTDGLILHLDAGNNLSYPGSGTTWTALLGTSSTGTLTNGPTYTTDSGGAIVFDGVDDYVACSGSFTSTQFTFISWIKRNGSQVNYAGILFSRGSTVTGLNYVGLSNQLGYHWNGVAASYNWGSGLVLPDQTWCMVAVSVNSSSAVAYLCQASGITSATNNISHTSTTIDAIRINSDSEGSRFAKQSTAIASIYNRALSAAEIQQNFNATRERFGV